MATKAGVILTQGEGDNKKYCVVVQRFYPQVKHIEIDCGALKLSNVDLDNGLKIFVRGKDDDRFPSHPELYVKPPDPFLVRLGVLNRFSNLFDFKIGFPKGGSGDRNSSNLKVTAQRELREETGISLNDDKFKEEDTFETDNVKYYKCELTEDEVVNPKPERDYEHEIHSVHFLTLSELKYLQRNARKYLSRDTQNVISSLGEVVPSERTDNINKILTYRTMDDGLYQDYVQAVAHACYLRGQVRQGQELSLNLLGGGKKYRQKGGEPKINHYHLYSAGQVIELFNLMLSDEEKESLDNTTNNDIRKIILSNLEKRKVMESPVEILKTALAKKGGGATRKNKKSRRNSNKRTKRR